MKISELPKEVKKKALKYLRNSTVNLETDDLRSAFDWAKAPEGLSYWMDWYKKESMKPEFEGTIEGFKPKQYQIGIDTFERMEANCNTDEIIAFCKGNIDKYNWRKKQSDLEDFKKIIDYANFAIKQLNDKE